MSAYLLLPVSFLTFWFFEGPFGMIRFYGSLNRSLLHMLSFPLLFETFFKPLKNEYREGLVGFSLGMGIAVKSVLIFVDLLIFLLILFLEIVSIAVFILLPFISLMILFNIQI